MTAAVAQPDTSYQPPKPTVKTSRNSFASKLVHAIKASDKRLSPFLTRRTRSIKAFCGPYYGVEVPVETQPRNTIYSFVTAITPALSMWSIETDGTSSIPWMRRPALLVGMATSRELAAMHAGQTYAELTLDAFFGPAISKIGIARGPLAGNTDFQDWRQDPNRVFWRRVSPDDYILDPRCRRREEAQFEGDRFIIAAEDARAHGYKSEILDRLDKVHAEKLAQKGTRGLSHPGGNDDDPLYDEYRLADVYLYREGVVATLACETGTEEFGFLDEVEWDGPEGGPYDMLYFRLPPDNPMPVTPVEQQIDMHEAVNSLARKVKEQGDAAKTNWGYAVQGEEDAKRLGSAKTHQLVPMLDPNLIKEFTFPGPSRELLDAIAVYQDWQNRDGPNVSLMGGLEADQKTLGQTQMLFAQAGDRLAEMKASCQQFLQQVVRRVAYYVWQRDDAMPMQLDIAGASIPLAWGKDERPDQSLGDFLDLAFEVSVYTMGLDSPQAQYARTVGLLKDVVVPLMPQAQAMGQYADVAALVAGLGRKANIRDTDEWFRSGPPTGETGGVNMQGGGNETNITLPGGRGRPAPTPAVAETGETQ